MNVSFRAARASDADMIAAILSDWVDETSWMVRIHSRDEDRGFGAFLIEKTDVRVAENGQVRGFLAHRDGMIDALYVAEEVRGHGIGSALLDDAKAGRERLELWAFQANEEARSFYADHGFVEDRLSDGAGNDEKLPDVHMTWVREGNK